MYIPIAYIFETTSKREMIARFCKVSREKFYAGTAMPEPFQKGIAYLDSAAEPPTHISKKHILEALKAFIISESKCDIYTKIFSKIGKIVCFYLLANKQAMQVEVESISFTPIPKRVNMKGVLQQTGRAVIVASGIALSFVYLLGGAALSYAGTRLPVEDAIIRDPGIQNIINHFRKIDFTPLYEKIQ